MNNLFKGFIIIVFGVFIGICAPTPWGGIGVAIAILGFGIILSG